MDFILLFSLIGTIFWQQLLFLYDIVCQWLRNLKKCMAQFPDYMKILAAQLNNSGLRHDVSNEVSDGLHAYAAKQAHIMHSMAMKFASMWYPELVKNRFAVEWPLQYILSGTSVTDLMLHDEDD
jgi:hypothetical protein